MAADMVQACNHCKGTSVCKAGFGGSRSCPDCLDKAGLDKGDSKFDPIMCMVCEGKGQVWVGPAVTQLIPGLGETPKCAHCAGAGVCKQGFGHSRSCRACLIRAKKDPGDSGFNPVTCGACNGQGSVWVGPDIVQAGHKQLS